MQEAAGDYRPEGLEVQVPQVAPGCVQLSSGRIARPTPKTAPSRASSAELSETFPGDGEPASPGLATIAPQGRSHMHALTGPIICNVLCVRLRLGHMQIC